MPRRVGPPAAPTAADQRSLDELLDSQRDEAVYLPFQPEDIGGELVSILSKGLYTNPLAAVREYVQNAVDGHAKTVTIKTTANSLLITDDGLGMGLDAIIRARQFGLSPKLYAENVGFRGIGIYAGFDLCKRARIHTKTEGTRSANVLVFDFEGMRAVLDRARASSDPGDKPTLVELISRYTWFSRDDAEYPDDVRFTHVDLQDLSPEHLRRLSNRDELRPYLLQTLPIDWSEDFEYRDEINEQLAREVPGYNPIQIELQLDGHESERVVRAPIPGLQHPKFGTATFGRRAVAFWWAALNKEGKRIAPTDDGEVAGLVYKVKGFTIGDRDKLRQMFAKQDFLYLWWTGEVYVTDPRVLPNAERDDFETSPDSEGLRLAVQDVMASLLKEVQDFQKERLAQEKLEEAERTIARLKEEIENEAVDPLEAAVQLTQVESDLNKRKGKLAGRPRKEEADKLIAEANRLKTLVKHDVAQTQTPGRARTTVSAPSPRPSPAVQPVPSLVELMDSVGWSADPQLRRVIDALQSALEDVLGANPSLHRRVYDLVATRLTGSEEDE
jgi:hypothetical protein